MARVRIGISGWRYEGWRGRFYPEGLPQKRELEFAAGHFDNDAKVRAPFDAITLRRELGLDGTPPAHG